MQDDQSIDELIKAEVAPKIEEFSLIPPDNQYDSNLNLLTPQQDWKLDSIHFTEMKQHKEQEKEIKFETQEEIGLLKEESGIALLD